VPAAAFARSLDQTLALRDPPAALTDAFFRVERHPLMRLDEIIGAGELMMGSPHTQLALPLPQPEAIADFRASVIQNAGYADCCNIILSLEISRQRISSIVPEVHAVRRHA
jgi:hypothetical protein